jgi:mannose/fructose-specific phosphotransferase system component IIA
VKNIILITHGDLCKGFISAYDVICGGEDILSAIPLYSEDSPETMAEKIKTALQGSKADDFIIIMTDIPAGSTTKSAIPFLYEYKNLYIISGLNLGLLLEIALCPFEEDISETIRHVVEQSKENIQFINDCL